MKAIIFCLGVAILSFSYAHEGHDHGTGQVQATKGGVIKKAGTMYFEVVGTQSKVEIYPLKESGPDSKVLKAVPLSEVKITANYKLPRKNVGTPISLKPAGDHFIGTINAASSHRYEVVINIEAGKVKDEMSYQVEPQE